jgi:L-lactate permease
MVRLEITYKDSDYARANRFLLRRKPATWIVYSLPAILVIGMSVRLYQVASDNWNWWVVPAMFGLLIWLYSCAYVAGRWNTRRIIRRQLKSNPSAQSPQIYNISDAGISMTGALHNLDLKWEAIVKVLESKQDFFLYISKGVAYFLPKQAFASGEQEAELRGILRSKLGEKAKVY